MDTYLSSTRWCISDAYIIIIVSFLTRVSQIVRWSYDEWAFQLYLYILLCKHNAIIWKIEIEKLKFLIKYSWIILNPTSTLYILYSTSIPESYGGVLNFWRGSLYFRPIFLFFFFPYTFVHIFLVWGGQAPLSVVRYWHVIPLQMAQFFSQSFIKGIF